MYKHTCLYCGKEFQSPRRLAQFCTDKSTCRVGYRRREKKEEAKAEKEKEHAQAAAMVESVRALHPPAAEQLRRLIEETGSVKLGFQALQFALTLSPVLAQSLAPQAMAIA
jgi:predicted  nucleic acid-binding Zn-ribbon protein